MSNQHLAREIAILMQIPIERHIAKSKGYRIVTAVFQVIKEALLRGEKVVIPGFGTFKVVTTGPKWQANYKFAGPAKGHVDYIYLAPRKKAFFAPSKPLRTFVDRRIKDESQS